MRIEPSGVVMIGECEIQTSVCTALRPAPITAVWTSPGRRQVNICRSCLEEMVRLGQWEVPGAKISRKYDIAVSDRAGHIQLVVEVKQKPFETAMHRESWTTLIRRNLLIHSGIPSSVYFMLAIYPTPFYLWTPEEEPDAPPSYIFDVQGNLVQYESLYEDVLDENCRQESVVSTWLSDLMANHNSTNTSLAWWKTSGLSAAIEGGSLVSQSYQSRHREPQAA